MWWRDSMKSQQLQRPVGQIGFFKIPSTCLFNFRSEVIWTPSSLISVTWLVLGISGLRTGVDFQTEMAKITDLSKLTVIFSTFASWHISFISKPSLLGRFFRQHSWVTDRRCTYRGHPVLLPNHLSWQEKKNGPKRVSLRSLQKMGSGSE